MPSVFHIVFSDVVCLPLACWPRPLTQHIKSTKVFFFDVEVNCKLFRKIQICAKVELVSQFLQINLFFYKKKSSYQR